MTRADAPGSEKGQRSRSGRFGTFGTVAGAVPPPSSETETIDASVGAGDIDLLGETTDGVSVTRSYMSEGFGEAEATLTLDLDVAAGSIEVTR